jgi:L-threonylcarbamoyladenylate synthase
MLDFQDDIEECLTVLRSGGIVLYPTDTIWGIGCDATNANAVQKIYALKKRSESKSMIILVADERDILKYTSHADLQIFDFLESVKKPTTVIYEGAIGLADNLVHSDGTVAIRLVKEMFSKSIVKRFRKPIVSTSANISGEAAPHFFREISEEIKNGVDYIVQYRQGDETRQDPSSVVKWNNDGTVTFLRQ